MKRRLAWSLLVALAPIAVATSLGCSSGSSGGGACGGGGADDAGLCTAGQTQAYATCADLTTPSVSFHQTVQPVLNASCGISTMCHVKQASSSATKYLTYLGGAADAGVDASEVLSGIVNVPAQEDPGMMLVAPADPGKSYLMHKLDGDHCLFADACNATGFPLWSDPTPCGATMPFTRAQLPPEVRDQIRRWIAQGAKND